MNESTNIATMPTRAAVKPLKECRTLAEAFDNAEFMQRIKQSVPKHMSPERMLRTFVQAVQRTPKLMKADMRSVLGAMLTCSQIGLEPNSPLQHAHLIPFDVYKYDRQTRQRNLERTDVQLIFGYPGLLELAYRTGKVVSIHAHVVYERDEFDFSYGSQGRLHHRPTGRHAPDERPIYAYVFARLEHGEYYEVLPYEDILRIRDQSQGYRSALAAKASAEERGWKMPATWTEAPWVKHEIAMARKTVFRAGVKWLPKSVELAGALDLDEKQDRGAVDFGKTIDGTATILDGFDLQDESEPADPGAAYGMREAPEPEPPAPQRAPEPPRQQAAPAPAAPRQQAAPPPPASEPGFEAYLLDEIGEPTLDGDMQPILYTDPAAWARALANAWMGSANRDALRENNADGMQDAAARSPEAAEILAEISAPQGVVDAEFLEVLEVAMPTTPKGSPHIPNYKDALKAAAAQVTAEQYTEFVAVNTPTILSLPSTARLQCVQIVHQRAKALGLPLPRILPAPGAQAQQSGPAAAPEPEPQPQDSAQAAPADEAPAEDRERERLERYKAELDACATVADVQARGNSTAMQTVARRWETERPELARELREHGERRIATLRAAAQGGAA